MPKGNFYQLVEFISLDEIDPEVRDKLDHIATAAEGATLD